jgi:acyl-CoA reductase-like NAD-dependent aldehyde dehydrogenase
MDYGLLIDNQDQSAQAAGTFERINPFDGSVASRAAAALSPDVDRAVNAAAEAFKSWSLTGPSERRTILNKAADLLSEWTPRFLELGIAETGGTGPWHGFNCYFAAKILREAAAATTQIKGEVIPSDRPGSLSMAMRQPIGVLVGMAPWNAAQILGVRAFALPIACGNTIVFKASEKCPGTHRLLGDLMIEAGLPKGVLNIITHDAKDAPEVVNALIDHPLTRHINFTGSTRVGRIIAERAARHLKPCLLELGGKAPLVVLDDAHIPGAVNAAKFGAFMNQGQICMSTERVIVADKIADAFIAEFANASSKLVAGDPKTQVHLGSVIDQGAMDHVRDLVKDAESKGAVRVAGILPDAGTVMQATVMDHITSDMRLYGEESFGPVVSVIRARDDAHAIEIANDTSYGLSSSVFTQDIRRGLEVARQIQAGICHINGPTVFDEAQMPFGGVKSSGYGRFGGSAGIDAFTELRWITIEDPAQPYPF